MEKVSLHAAIGIALNLLGMIEVRGSANIKYMAQAIDLLEKVQDVASANKNPVAEESDHNKPETPEKE